MGKKPDPNSTAGEIRKHLDNGVSSPKEIVQLINDGKPRNQHIKVDYVSTVKTEWLKKRRKATPQGDFLVALDLAADLVGKVGAEQARQMIDAAERMRQKLQEP